MLIEAVYGAHWREKLNSSTLQTPLPNTLSEDSSSDDNKNTSDIRNKNRSMLVPSNVLYLSSEGEEEEQHDM